MRQDADRARAKELFRQMSAQEKADHIFHYYWLHMLVGVFVLIVGIVFWNTYRANAATRDQLYIGVQSNCYDILCPAVEELAQQAQWPEGLNFLAFPSMKGADGMGSMQMAMYLTADEMDFILCDEYTMRVLLADETLNASAAAMEETPLGALVDGAENLFVLVLHDTGRAEKVAQFIPVLMGSPF